MQSPAKQSRVYQYYSEQFLHNHQLSTCLVLFYDAGWGTELGSSTTRKLVARRLDKNNSCRTSSPRLTEVRKPISFTPFLSV